MDSMIRAKSLDCILGRWNVLGAVRVSGTCWESSSNDRSGNSSTPSRDSLRDPFRHIHPACYYNRLELHECLFTSVLEWERSDACRPKVCHNSWRAYQLWTQENSDWLSVKSAALGDCQSRCFRILNR